MEPFIITPLFFQYDLNNVENHHVEIISDGPFFCFVRHEPVGICGQIIPVSREVINLQYMCTEFKANRYTWKIYGKCPKILGPVVQN